MDTDRPINRHTNTYVENKMAGNLGKKKLPSVEVVKRDECRVLPRVRAPMFTETGVKMRRL